MKIPKIIFQTWKTSDIPDHFIRFQESWKSLNSDFEFELWTDVMYRSFVKDYFPEFLPRYEDYEYPIQRADAIRYMLLYYFGGIYIDLDIECLKPITPLIENVDCFFGLEVEEHAINHNVPRIISNAFMGCVARHALMEKILNTLFGFTDIGYSKNDKILHSTGPMMLNKAINVSVL